MPRIAFAPVRSRGDLADAGRRAECAGLYSVTATVAPTGRPYVATAAPPAAVTVAEGHDAERDHEGALAGPHRGERDLGAAGGPL
jgi:hypothetical protein